MLTALVLVDCVGSPLQTGQAIAVAHVEPVCAAAFGSIHGSAASQGQAGNSQDKRNTHAVANRRPRGLFRNVTYYLRTVSIPAARERSRCMRATRSTSPLAGKRS